MRMCNPCIIVSWFDTEGMKQRSHMVFKGDVDRRRIHREVRRFIQKNFGTPTAEYVKKLVMANYRAFNRVSVTKEDTGRAMDAQIEAWIRRIQDDSDEGEPDTGSQMSVHEEASGDLPAVPSGYVQDAPEQCVPRPQS